MMEFIDTIKRNPRKLLLKSMKTGEIEEYEIQPDLENFEVIGTPLNKETFDALQNELLLAMKTKIQLNEEFETKFLYKGKKVYGKIIEIETMPSTTDIARYSTGLTNVEYLVQPFGIMKNKTDNSSVFPLPFNFVDDNSANISLYVYNNNITVKCGTDRSIYKAEVTLLYIKNT